MTHQKTRLQQITPVTISTEAIELCMDAEVIDLHIDTFIPHRLWGYDPLLRHNGGPFGRHFFGHLDLPRMQLGGLNAAMWSITTNPFRRASSRWAVFLKNLDNFLRMVENSKGQLKMARSHSEYQSIRAADGHAVLLSIQGGNALEDAPEGPLSIPDKLVTRVTLIHLTNAVYGASSSPDHYFRRNKGLSKKGGQMVEALNAARIFVDLAHIHPTAFWDALNIHHKEIPPIVTHTGVDGVRKHWRNLDDDQIRAIAERGGVIGVIFAANFLKRRGGPSNADMVIEHLEHIIKIGGEGVASLGSDLDGAISPPQDLSSGYGYAVLIDRMLKRGWKEERIRGILGLNFLSSFSRLRP